MPQVAPQILRDQNPPISRVRDADLTSLLEAIRPLLRGKEEQASLDGQLADDRKGLEIHLVGASFDVPLNSILDSRQNGTWSILAGGVLENLRERHSLRPERFFELHEVYDEAVKAVARIASEGLTPKELDALDVKLFECITGLHARAAVAKATVNCYVDEIVKLLKASLPEPKNG